MTRKKNAVFKTFEDEKVMENENCGKPYSENRKVMKIDGEERREKR